VASSADEIYLSPTGYLELKGLSAELVYIKGSLDKLGLQADFVGIGQYKTAPDMFTHSTMSEAESIQTNELLDDLFNQMISDISSSRGFTEENFRSILDSGPFSPKLALKKGLVNGLLFDEEITEHPEKYFNKKYLFSELADPAKVTHYSNYWGDPAKVAIVYATGEISGKYSRDGMFGGRTMGEKTLSEALRQARTDREIKAVVLRVNSPGGEVMATDGIYRELEKIKSKKPLIISIGNVGASGGYYIACVGDEIFMMPGTITGSIGIFTGKLVARGLYDKLGANKVVLKRGLHADIRSDWRPINDEEKLLVYTELKEFYDDFVAKVARWRRLETAQVDSLGQGRVWSGQRALDLKLGTNQGGLMDAINLAINKSNLPQGQPVKYEIYPKYGFSLFSGFRPTGGLASILADKLTDTGIFGSLNESEYYYRLPYNIEIK
jgi:protease-4